MPRDEHIWPIPSCTEASFRARQFDRIDVYTNKAASGLYSLEDRARMTAPSEGTIHGDVPRRWTQALHYFPRHYRDMHTGRCPAGGKNFLHVCGVPLGIQLFVLVVETSGVPAGVALSALALRRIIKGRQRLSMHAM